MLEFYEIFAASISFIIGLAIRIFFFNFAPKIKTEAQELHRKNTAIEKLLILMGLLFMFASLLLYISNLEYLQPLLSTLYPSLIYMYFITGGMLYGFLSPEILKVFYHFFYTLLFGKTLSLISIKYKKDKYTIKILNLKRIEECDCIYYYEKPPTLIYYINLKLNKQEKIEIEIPAAKPSKTIYMQFICNRHARNILNKLISKNNKLLRIFPILYSESPAIKEEKLLQIQAITELANSTRNILIFQFIFTFILIYILIIILPQIQITALINSLLAHPETFIYLLPLFLLPILLAIFVGSLFIPSGLPTWETLVYLDPIYRKGYEGSIDGVRSTYLFTFLIVIFTLFFAYKEQIQQQTTIIGITVTTLILIIILEIILIIASTRNLKEAIEILAEKHGQKIYTSQLSLAKLSILTPAIYILYNSFTSEQGTQMLPFILTIIIVLSATIWIYVTYNTYKDLKELERKLTQKLITPANLNL